MEILHEHDFDTTDDFFEECGLITGAGINSFTLNTRYTDIFYTETNSSKIKINEQYYMIFDSGGYSLFTNCHNKN